MASLTQVEQDLISCVERGEVLDLAGDEPVDEHAMRCWGAQRTIRAGVLRDILRGRHAPDPDPHGLRIRGARIAGRLDLDNITSTIPAVLVVCVLDEGITAQDAELRSLAIRGCRLEHPTAAPINAARLIIGTLAITNTAVNAHTQDGAVTLRSAHIGGPLSCRGAVLSNTSGPALDANVLQSEESVFMDEGFSATGTGNNGAVDLRSARIGGQLSCSGAMLSNTSGPALNANGLQVAQTVFMDEGFSATGTGNDGAVDLHAAHIGGQLGCRGSVLSNDSGPALNANGLQSEQDVILDDGFSATGTGNNGAVNLLAAHIGGQLICRGAVLRNDSGPALDADGLQIGQGVFLDEGFSATGAGEGVVLDLNQARIGGALCLAVARLTHLTAPQHLLDVDGLVYPGLPHLVPGDSWLRLLREATPRYAAQPYQHLAAAYRAAGHDREARHVLIQQRRDQIQRGALTGRAERGWARLTGFVLGYGYQPWRALLGLLATILTAIVITLILGAHGALARVHTPPDPVPVPCPVIDQLSAGLDLGTPLITTNAPTRCANTATATGQALTITGWTLRLAAWAFATLFIAGFTSAVRKT